MSKSCCTVGSPSPTLTARYRRALWIALALNAAMFIAEFGASFRAESVSLLADAVDFAGDAANYGLSLGALALGAVWQSRAALTKGASMTAYGLFVLGMAVWGFAAGTAPEPLTMSAVGLLALIANVGVAVLLYAHREGNANMRSVWLCSRNDAIGNAAVLAAAAGVFGTGSGLPDLMVAAVMATLGITAGLSTVRQARRELSLVRAHQEAQWT